MADPSRSGDMSTGLLKVVERAKREPEGRFHSLAHLIDVPALRRAYDRMRKEAAAGVDGVTKEAYGEGLESRLEDLHERLKTMRYRHQPILRVHIPKENGKTRPLGISAFEDKLVQEALREVLEAVYEPIFKESSYGFRPGRSAHDALRALDRAVGGFAPRQGWILEGDIVSFFDSLDRNELKKMLQVRVPDGSLLRLVGKCLHVGVLDGEEYSEPEVGSAQGSVLSPLLGNIYLHYVLDEWFEREVKPRLGGKATLVRYADDFVIAIEQKEDAQRVMEELQERMQRYGLTLHPEKTRLVPFQRPPTGQQQQGGKGPASFDFLGFTLYWRRTSKAGWNVRYKTRTARLRRAVQTVARWCRRHRHMPVQEQQEKLNQKLRGHYNYFGVNGNLRSMEVLWVEAKKVWRKWLDRRSQRGRMPWWRFQELLKRHPLERPTIRVPIWSA